MKTLVSFQSSPFLFSEDPVGTRLSREKPKPTIGERTPDALILRSALEDKATATDLRSARESVPQSGDHLESVFLTPLSETDAQSRGPPNTLALSMECPGRKKVNTTALELDASTIMEEPNAIK